MSEFIPKKNIAQLLFCFILLPAMLSVSSAEAKRKPSWVKQRPSDAQYYIGRAMIKKGDGNINYRTDARNNALKEMSSEIKVNISSNSILRQFENNYQVREEFEASTHQSVQATLEGYEVLSWENKKEYWVMVRLNKDSYALRQKQKLDYAKKMCATYYYEGQKAVEQGDIYEGLLFYTKAIKAIKRHTNDDLSYRDIEGSLNLGSDIFSAVQNAFGKIMLETDQPIYTLQFSKEMKLPLTVKASYYDEWGNKQALSNLPLRYIFTKGEGEITPVGTTNLSGQSTCDITRLISKRKSQQIKAEFDLDSFLEKETEEDKVLLRAFFHDEYLPVAFFNIEVQKSSAFLIISEVVFGTKPANTIFANMIRAELGQSYFNLTDQKDSADFVVTIDADFKNGGERKGSGYSVFVVFADFHMRITDNKSNMEIFADGFNGLRGMQPGNVEYALKNVRQKARQKIIAEIFPKMEKVNL
ncbi:LPP20 lipoprotein [Saccharicrinis carchari]|uniref:LPP20 lipoprotein n=1 Tax=Saccharicrinis carchari TaxID=1168039 RepID=A0A521DII7_SACCC|nr:LPP20 family lipoprotein [Saccharicrinis carchari]SMO71527.1 LPP20 lipoprotein [Saccharicrinis carchari]